jgi:hypothetical protein
MVVALSPGHQAQVAQYQSLATTLLACGTVALLGGLYAGIAGQEAARSRKKK